MKRRNRGGLASNLSRAGPQSRPSECSLSLSLCWKKTNAENDRRIDLLLALEKRRLSYIPCGIIALDLAKAKKITTYLQGARQPHTIGGPRAYRNFPPFFPPSSSALNFCTVKFCLQRRPFPCLLLLLLLEYSSSRKSEFKLCTRD